LAEVSRMHFKSVSKPEENGVLVINDDGTFQVKPSDVFREAIARLEEVAIKRSETFGTRLGLGLIAAGAVFVALGWIAGRIFGSMGSTLSRPRSIGDVEIDHNENGGFAVRMRGIESRLQTIVLSWNADEVVQAEATEFTEKFRDLQDA